MKIENKIPETEKEYAVQYLDELPQKRAFPDEASLKELGKLTRPLPDGSKYPPEVLEILKEAGFQILNEVKLNQVLVSFGDAMLTNRIIKKVQDDGTS